MQTLPLAVPLGREDALRRPEVQAREVREVVLRAALTDRQHVHALPKGLRSGHAAR